MYLSEGTHKIVRHEPCEAKEALGIQIRPDFCMTDEKKYLQDKVQRWCDAVRTKRLSQHEAWYSFTVTIMKTLEYPLLATTFTQSDINDIMKPLLKTILPLCGFQRNLPRKLLYGTLSTRGCNLKNPFLTQVIFHLQAILQHAHRHSPTHLLLPENFELVQWYVGSEHNFWELSFAQYGFLAPAG